MARPRHQSGDARIPISRKVLGALAVTAICGMAGLFPAVNPPAASAAVYDPAADAYSMASLTAVTGAPAWWGAGYTGAGIDVALIDTGVSPVAGLDAPGKILNGPDLSIESQATNLSRLDTNGHGTFMAGVIAGKDSALTVPYAGAPASAYRGMAPDARIVSVKVGSADGGVDVSQVIAAINWVIQHKNDNGMNIRVLNLSYGTNSAQSSAIDPLSFAVEKAWKAGIVVVVAAGNAGYQKGGNSPCLADPAYNPYVIAVGGIDTQGTLDTKDDKVGVYSSAGAGGGCKNPDFVAPGSHVQGLRVANSYLDATHPEGILGARYFRGSGTSQAAAAASGAVALVLQKFPSLTPDQVKKYFATYASSLAATTAFQQGPGEIKLAPMLLKTPANYTQSLTNATGSGSLEAARGTDHLTRDGVLLSGEKDIFGKPFTSGTAGSAWSGGTWNGSSWTGSSWTGSSWTGSSWTGSSWTGSSWTGSSWTGSSWTGSSWSGSGWSGAAWSGGSWT
jgi:serine protease AprX